MEPAAFEYHAPSGAVEAAALLAELGEAAQGAGVRPSARTAA
jgi:hypothetical protein